MRRILTILAIGFAVFVPSSAASAEECHDTVNVCPTAQACSGYASVCPMAHPDDCASYVDVCLDFVGP